MSLANVFIVDMDSLEAYQKRFQSCLSFAEKTKARSLRTKTLQKHYIIAHGVLRTLLSQYTHVPPKYTEYSHNEFGKPFCKGTARVHFNMSHSGHLVGYIFSKAAEVGIDIEYKKQVPHLEAILSEVATAHEQSVLQKINPDDRADYFYKIWTIKEAFLKTLGTGLTQNLLDIETSVLPTYQHKVVSFRGQTDFAKSWTFAPINSIPNYIGTVAIHKALVNLNIQTLDSAYLESFCNAL